VQGAAPQQSGLEKGAGRALERGVEAQALRLNTKVTSLDLYYNGLGEGGGRALAETLRLNSTLHSFDLGGNGLGEGGGRALTETLRLNTTIRELDLRANGLGEGRGRALAEALRITPRSRSSGLTIITWERKLSEHLVRPGRIGDTGS
jgi:hypothetical protein